MNKSLLPIGSLIELEDGKRLIIIAYERNEQSKISYLCGGYPTYYLTDLIPFSKVKEFKEKYKFYNIDTYLDIDGKYKIIHEGYKNEKFYEFQNEFYTFD